MRVSLFFMPIRENHLIARLMDQGGQSAGGRTQHSHASDIDSGEAVHAGRYKPRIGCEIE